MAANEEAHHADTESSLSFVPCLPIQAANPKTPRGNLQTRYLVMSPPYF